MKKILVIDDSKFVRNFHINILQSAGFSADAAEDGIEGLEKAMTTDYDLVISDINMRNMDGLTFTRKLRETGSTIPIMIISTQSSDDDRMAGFEAGANVFVTKPVRPEKLIENIKLLINQ